MNQIVWEYYRNNARKLRRIVDKILLHFGGLSEKDRDDFYSLANEIFVEVLKRYDGMRCFDSFLYSCLFNRIRSEFTRRNREKRKADRMAVSLDTPISLGAPVDDEEIPVLGDYIADSIDIEAAVLEKEECYSRKVLLYFDRLSRQQQAVLKLIIEGYYPEEIRKELQIDKKQYEDCCMAIHSYRNVSLLY